MSGAARMHYKNASGDWIEVSDATPMPTADLSYDAGLDRTRVEPLGTPGVARQIAAGAASVNTLLTSTCRRISIHARSADIRYAVGSSAQTANAATSHFIAAGERLDIDVPATPNIAVIRAGTSDGVLEVTELS
jgi:hypothetical protein